MSVKDWHRLLSRIVESDKKLDSKRGLIALSIVLGIISIGVCIYFYFFVNKETYLVAIFFGIIVMEVVLVLLDKRLKKHDLTNELRLFFFPILNELMIKEQGNARLTAKLDFNDPRAVIQPEVKSIDRYVNDYREHGEQKIYASNYIIASTELVNEVTLEFVLQDKIMDSEFTRENGNKTLATEIDSCCQIQMKIPKHLNIGFTHGLSNTDSSKNLTSRLEISEKENHYVGEAKIKMKRKGFAVDEEATIPVVHFTKALDTFHAHLRLSWL